MKGVATLTIAIITSITAGCTKDASAPARTVEYIHHVAVTVSATAAPGEKLILAPSAAGIIQAGSLGLVVLAGAKKPGAIPNGITVGDQLLQHFDFSAFDPAYWVAGSALPGPHPLAKVIKFRISAKIYDQREATLIPTSTVLISKINRAFRLWQSVYEAKLAFQYDGTYEAGAPEGSAAEPIIFVDLTGVAPDGTENWQGDALAMSSATGSIPDTYANGRIHFNTKGGGLHALNFKTIIHEIGHVLGLSHAAVSASAMAAEATAWVTQDTLAFGPQDRADLIRAWNPTSPTLYRIEGEVVAPDTQAAIAVFAVNTSNGNVYSDLIEPGDNRHFRIAILEAGNYRLMAKGYEATGNASVLPSWYVQEAGSTNNPGEGTLLSLSSEAPTKTGIKMSLIPGTPPFRFFSSFPWSVALDGLSLLENFRHSFIGPGESGVFGILDTAEPLTRLEVYGSASGVTLSNMKTRTLP